jgi:hypothetical protein
VGGTWWRFVVALAVLVPASWMSRPATGASPTHEGVTNARYAFIVVLDDADPHAPKLSVLSTAGMPGWPAFRLPPWPASR